MLLLCHFETRSLAAGLLSIASHLERNGVAVEIVHDQMERRIDPSFDLAAYAERVGARAVGLSLHWAHQTAATLQQARVIKERLPQVYIFVGGLTAATFAQQIIEGYPFIDSVVVGDGEEPTLQLMRALESGEPGRLSTVPNLVHRIGEVIEATPRSYQVDKEAIAELDYGRYDLMRHGLAHARGMEGLLSVFFDQPGYFQPTGKGCAFRCTYCGGSYDAQGITAGRKSVRYRPEEVVVREIAEQAARGSRSVFFCFDPAPDGKYYPRLFERIREEIPGPLNCGFSSWRLPGPALRDALKQTFVKSYVELSPEVADEDLRLATKGKGAAFTNAELESTLEALVAAGIGVELYFSYFHSGDPDRETVETIDYIQRLTGRFGRRITPLFLALSTDPAATRTLNLPEGIELLVRTVQDYERASARADFRSNLMAYRPTCLSMAEFDDFSLAIEMFSSLHSGLPVLSRAIHLARGAAGMLSLMRRGARIALDAGTPPRSCVVRGLAAALDPALLPDVSPAFTAMGRMLGESGSAVTASYAVAPEPEDPAAHGLREPTVIRVPAGHLNYVAAAETLRDSNPAPEGQEIDVLALRVGNGLIFNTLTPAVRALLQRCRRGPLTETELLQGIPAESVPAAKHLIDLFAANGLAAFEVSGPTELQEIAILRQQASLKAAAEPAAPS